MIKHLINHEGRMQWPTGTQIGKDFWIIRNLDHEWYRKTESISYSGKYSPSCVVMDFPTANRCIDYVRTIEMAEREYTQNYCLKTYKHWREGHLINHHAYEVKFYKIENPIADIERLKGVQL